MSPEAQVALIVGIIAAVAALGGALGGTGLGWWLNRNSERRGEKRAALVEFLSAIDSCQQACSLVAVGVTEKMSDVVLTPYRTRALDAVHRVETAGNLAILSVGPEHEQTLKNGMLGCAKEVTNANHGVLTMGIVEARVAILALARKELR